MSESSASDSQQGLVRRWRDAPKWLIESAVIVTSILLAFGIDAWWEERQDRREEAEILAGLEREFIDYRASLVSAMDRHSTMMEAMAELLRAMESGAWESTELTLDQAIGRSLYPPTTELGGGVRDALVQAGRLELIADRALREKLALWPGVYFEVLDDEVFSRDMVFKDHVPYLTGQGYDLSGLFDFVTAEWPVPRRSLADNPAEVTRILSDPVYRAKIQIRFSYWDHAGGEYQAALAAADDILERIARARRDSSANR